MKTIVWFTGNASAAASSRMIAALRNFAQRRGWQLLVLPNPQGNAAMREELAFWKPDGVVTNPSYDPEVFGTTPVVIMAGRPADYRGNAVFIAHDATRTVDCAADELLSLGYRSFAYVNALGDKHWSREREDCFVQLVRRHGATCLVCASPSSDLGSPLRFQRRLRQFLADLPRPCALLAAHDLVGQYVLYAAQALGLSVPEELAVCSIDNDESICLGTSPTLTSVMTDFERAGTMAGEVFEQLMAGGHVPDGAYGPATVMRRGSTADFSRRDVAVLHAQEFIRRHVTDGITAADVIRRFDCTTRMAQLRFKQTTGHTIMDEILAARTEKAKMLMLDGDLPLEAVAQLSGWQSLRNFQHHFTKSTGLPPGQWKASRKP